MLSSRMLDLSSTLPSFGVDFATKSMASASDVLPEPLCPMRATFRMSVGAIAVIPPSYQSPPGARSPAFLTPADFRAARRAEPRTLGEALAPASGRDLRSRQVQAQ